MILEAKLQTLINLTLVRGIKKLGYGRFLSISRYRMRKGLPPAPSACGPLTDEPDWSYPDGRPGYLNKSQSKRYLRDQELGETIVRNSQMLFGSSRKLLSYDKTHHAKSINLDQKRTAFQYSYRHGPTKRCDPPPLDIVATLKDLFLTRKGYDFFKEEFRRTFLDKPFRTTIPKNIVFDKTEIFENFDNDESFKKWKAAADSDTLNGYSTAKLSRTPDGHALFHGFLDNRVPDDGATCRSGCVGLIGPYKPRDEIIGINSHWDWSRYNCVEVRLRGDGRRYGLVCNIADETESLTFFDTYCAHIYTRGGPYWETVRIPFSKLIYTHAGFIQDQQYWFPHENIKFTAITLEDSVDGPFNLEIDYIGLRYQTHPFQEMSSWEHYCHPHIKLKPIQVSCEPPDAEK